MPYMTVNVNFRGESFEVEGDYAPIRRGRFSGPPEKCYPDEGGEFEIAVVRYEDTDITLVVEHCFSQQVTDDIIALCAEKSESDYREEESASRAEYLSEQRQQRKFDEEAAS